MSDTDKIMRFMQSQTAARKMIHEDAKSDYKRIPRTNYNEWDEGFAMENRGYDDYDSYINEKNDYSQNINYIETVNNHKTNINTPNNINKTKLPKEIVESMIGSTINENISILDNLYDFNSINKQQNAQNNQNEVKSLDVDYDKIKSICEDVMKKYASALKKSILTESKNNTEPTLKAMKIGNKFSFIDDNGNIYEAKLILKGNINKK